MSDSSFSLSILIPAFNSRCAMLVEALSAQAMRTDGLEYEILVAEDGSTNSEDVTANSIITALPHCRHILRQTNMGRAAVRNFLAREARYDHLLFIDSHMSVVSDDYLARYLACQNDDLVYGGYTITQIPKEGTRNLRYAYERACLDAQDYHVRAQKPYANFHTSNFMVRRDIMLSFPLDERFKRYGYEDVLFGKKLRDAGITIRHIDNPLGFNRFESNARFMEKTDEGLDTLCEFRNELRGFSQLLLFNDTINRWHLKGLLRVVWRVSGNAVRRNLVGDHPSLLLFKVYKALKAAQWPAESSS